MSRNVAFGKANTNISEFKLPSNNHFHIILNDKNLVYEKFILFFENNVKIKQTIFQLK